MLSPTKFLILPGLMNSGPDHWQSLWEARLPNAIRVKQASWDRPVLSEWLKNLEAELRRTDGKVVLIAHSLGAVLAAQLESNPLADKVQAAFLVAPADVESVSMLACARNFTPIPRRRLPFPSYCVVSANDPYLSLDRAKHFAKQWGSHLIDIGASGHINTTSGHGSWPEGWDLLQELCSDVSERRDLALHQHSA